MHMIKDFFSSKRILFILLISGIFIRIIGFGKVPGGVNQDEAFAGYEAWLLANYGMDS